MKTPFHLLGVQEVVSSNLTVPTICNHPLLPVKNPRLAFRFEHEARAVNRGGGKLVRAAAGERHIVTIPVGLPLALPDGGVISRRLVGLHFEKWQVFQKYLAVRPGNKDRVAVSREP